MRNYAMFGAGVLALGLAASVQAATYTGNGNGGFGGALGQGGSLSVTDDGSGNLVFTLQSAGADFGGNDVVVYLDTVAGGVSDTSVLTDEGDRGRQLVSGLYTNNPNVGATPATTRTVVNFASGFTADHAIEFETGVYGAVFDITNTNSSFTYVGGNSIGTSSPYTVTVSRAALGLSATDGFNLVASLISNSLYRSNEAIGATAPTDNPGFNGSLTFTGYDTFAAVPEPTSMAVLGLGAVGLLRRRKASIR